MNFKHGLFALFAVLALGAGMLSAGPASADRGEPPPAYVAMADGGDDPRGPGGFASVDGGGTKQICETGPSSTTCVGKGWIMAGVCKALGGDIVAGDPGGVFLCEFPKD